MSAIDSIDRRAASGAGNKGGAAAAALVLAAVVCPLAVHASVSAGVPELGAALALVVCLVLLAALGARRFAAVLALGLAAGGLGAATAGVDPALLAEIAGTAIFVPSIVVTATLAAMFGRTLRTDEVPLLTRLAMVARGTLPPAVESYTRGLTWMWAVLLGGLSVLCALLALFASFETWSLFANGLNYAIVAGAFAGEYLFRRWKLRHIHHPSFIEYVQFLGRSRRPGAEQRDAA